ncbi:glycosyltransferase family 4 protein [Tamlana sp. s12]|uniref:glycosyltransferase family 4 protein n=1 Tax=Tamlana sp. s12 TaxID=1630406 RepID=UPI00080241ED|nr:glycosyltransferase family 4 protein [Tamlana sp. s12]OBQ55385.1 glycosyl transferase family 1 [Tamlana sp. s12]QQY80935.1 glycosyltransferase family 4 protein [Tamlana sp. s12]
MNLAFLTPEYPHPKVNHAAGLGTSIGNLTKALVRHGHAVYVFVYGQKQTEDFIEDGIHFYLIADKDFAFAKWYHYRKYIQKEVQNIISKEHIQLLEVPDWTGISAFMKFSVPVVMRFHGSDTYFCHLEQRSQKLKNKWFETLAVRGAQAYIAPTNFAGEQSKMLFNIKNKPIKTIHYGLQLEGFTNTHPEMYTPYSILYLGTLIRKKGVLELPEVFKKVRQEYPQATLKLIGSDASDIQTGNHSTWNLLKEGFSKEDLNHVHYLGRLPYNVIQKHIQDAHVCVFPTYAETLGMVTIESMAMLKPVVNSNIGWAQELMEDGQSGYLVHPKAHGDYAEKTKALFNSKSKCLEMGKAARAYVEDHFDMEKQVVKNVEFYKKFIKS